MKLVQYKTEHVVTLSPNQKGMDVKVNDDVILTLIPKDLYSHEVIIVLPPFSSIKVMIAKPIVNEEVEPAQV